MAQPRNKAGFKVIVAGFSRTGTFSMRAALCQLLDGACYHGVDWAVLGSDEEMNFWEKALRKETTSQDWVDFFQGRGFRAACDFPANMHYK